MSHTVFLRYYSSDKAVAEILCDHLEKGGLPVWMAPRDISPSMGWNEQILSAVDAADVALLLYSSKMAAISQIERELSRAVANGGVVVVASLDETSPTAELSPLVSEENWLPVWKPPFESHLDEIARVVVAAIESKAAGVKFAPPIQRPETIPSPAPATTEEPNYEGKDVTAAALEAPPSPPPYEAEAKLDAAEIIEPTPQPQTPPASIPSFRAAMLDAIDSIEPVAEPEPAIAPTMFEPIAAAEEAAAAVEPSPSPVPAPRVVEVEVDEAIFAELKPYPETASPAAKSKFDPPFAVASAPEPETLLLKDPAPVQDKPAPGFDWRAKLLDAKIGAGVLCGLALLLVAFHFLGSKHENKAPPPPARSSIKAPAKAARLPDEPSKADLAATHGAPDKPVAPRAAGEGK
ncbi:toll/interleukin-1 receptor domain-containing protein [Methylocystis heyeri]|uniref:TIR domain-containing protein n=1 Tax=Methylocystis heyeri TaxID=391905 RepID=A0A6B8KGS5_9HYPH|nr:toll/interleukin-1 receptor domain-containing protein [Methylocystis heyeri]QGM45758.1 TIR domain-containing protein [Methylocystis heyeri]